MTNHAAFAEEDDDGFLGYVETAHDPGSSLLFATILFCIISYCFLPFLIAMGDKLDVKNRRQQTIRENRMLFNNNNNNKRRRRRRRLQGGGGGGQRQRRFRSTLNPLNYYRSNPTPLPSKNIVGVGRRNGDGGGGGGGDDDDNNEVPDPIFESRYDGPSELQQQQQQHYLVDDIVDDNNDHDEDDDNDNVDDDDDASSIVPSISSIASLHSHRTHKRRNYRNKRSMEKRHEMEEFELRMQQYHHQQQDHHQEEDYDHHDDHDNNPTTATGNTTTTTTTSSSKTKHHHNHNNNNNNRESSPQRSVMTPLDHDAVSIDDAISLFLSPTTSTSPTTTTTTTRHHLSPPNNNNNNNNGKTTAITDIPSTDDHDNNLWDHLLDLALWDFESKRIIKLAIPFATQALSTGILDILTVAVIGRVLGTKEVSAFVTVRTLIDVSSKFFGGFHESIATLCSQARGRHSLKLVGTYVQLSMVFYVICYIPFIIIWNVKMKSILLWFGFDNETAEIGKEYTQVYLMLELIDGVDESIHGLLDVIDLESYSTLVGVSQEIVTFLDILFCSLFAKPSLFVIGMIELFVALIFIGINVGTIIWRGWFEPYREGLIGNFALYNKQAVKMMLGTASSLSLGYLLTDGEWEILTLFASHLGPAEVAAWGILGVLWDALEQLTEAVADASEVRAAFLLGSGQPAKAKRSAHKSILLGVFLSLFLTSFVFMAGEDLATWFTNDPALQHIIADLIPLFGIANMTLTVGTISWTLLGSQGRYKLATIVAFVASWFVTLPLAALFTYHLRINLQGQTAAVVIGYMVGGSINAYFLFRSDWEALSLAVQKAANESEISPPPESQMDLDELAERTLDSPGILPNPALGTPLGPLIEGKPGEESFVSSVPSDEMTILNSTTEKEIL